MQSSKDIIHVKDPLVSIIVPVYNAEKFLHNTLESLKEQSLQDLEILCIDDGSSDSSHDIIKKFTVKDHRFHYFSQNNAGPGAARNRGLSEARGKYIVFQDADDLLHPQAVEFMLQNAENYQADVTICGFQSCSENFTGFDNKISLSGKPEIYTGDLAKYFDDWKKFRGHPWGKLYLRSAIGDIRFNDLRSGEDTFFNIDVVVQAKRIIVLPQALYIYRQVEQSLTHNKKHHHNSIIAGKIIGLHCIELSRQKQMSQEAALLLIRRYGTNCILLHLLLMYENKLLQDRECLELLNLAVDAILSIKEKMTFSGRIISFKYVLVYAAAVKYRSLIMVRLFARARTGMVKLFQRLSGYFHHD
jgi:glycosyltransferase involved in cell wall biosynthesis